MTSSSDIVVEAVSFAAGEGPSGEFLQHLERMGQPNDAELARFGHVATCDDRVVGHILLSVRPITLPKTADLKLHDFGKQSVERNLMGLQEGFVESFAVQSDNRRQGLGTELQLAAIESCRKRSLYQMRSWSSLDLTANYALKTKLGFAIDPGFRYAERIQEWVPGCSFVMKL